MSAPETLSDAQADGWDSSLLRCAECARFFDPYEEEWERMEFGPRCGTCASARRGEGDEQVCGALRPLASGVHVSKRAALVGQPALVTRK